VFLQFREYESSRATIFFIVHGQRHLQSSTFISTSKTASPGRTLEESCCHVTRVSSQTSPRNVDNGIGETPFFIDKIIKSAIIAPFRLKGQSLFPCLEFPRHVKFTARSVEYPTMCLNNAYPEISLQFFLSNIVLIILHIHSRSLSPGSYLGRTSTRDETKDPTSGEHMIHVINMTLSANTSPTFSTLPPFTSTMITLLLCLNLRRPHYYQPSQNNHSNNLGIQARKPTMLPSMISF